MKSSLFLLLSLLFAFLSCSDPKAEPASAEPAAPVQTQENYLPDLPAMTGEDFNWFVVNCTGIDYIMSSPDFSMSVSGQNDVRGDLGGISQNPVRRPKSCKSIGIIIYKSGSDRMFLGDLYADENCQYIVFRKDDKELYANALSAEGYQRFVNVFNQLKNMNQPK
ncbi:MAG: hypothetical protein IPI60_02250 [Saprospiraceae bacterium]|jgi:hypothetical protein|nr:hypothetical protein [Saprospiraceae bacterium]